MRIINIFSALGVCLIIGGKSYFSGNTCQIKNSDFELKNIIITGASSGIGKETVKLLALTDAKITLGCRSEKKAKEVIDQIKSELKRDNLQLEYQHLDLSDLDSVKNFAQIYKKNNKKLDILINNAGVYNTKFETTIQGFESNFGINHLGHYLLTQLLIDKLKESEQGRIIIVSSRAHERVTEKSFQFKELNQNNFSSIQSYPNSKLCNILFAQNLAEKQLKEFPQIKVFTCHPGIVRSQLFDNISNQNIFFKTMSVLLYPFIWYTTKNAEQGAQTQVYLALEQIHKLQNGGYYKECKLHQPSALAYNQNLIDELENYSKQATQKYLNEE